MCSNAPGTAQLGVVEGEEEGVEVEGVAGVLERGWEMGWGEVVVVDVATGSATTAAESKYEQKRIMHVHAMNSALANMSGCRHNLLRSIAVKLLQCLHTRRYQRPECYS